MTIAALASESLASHYAIDATLLPLAGDRDNNFLAQTGDGTRYVCKLMHPDCDLDTVKFQCAALEHLRDSSLNLPRVVKDRNGRDSLTIEVAGHERILWVLHWCPGILLADAVPHTEALQLGFGRMMAQLNLDLAGFRHRAMHRGHRWQLTHAAAVLPLVPQVTENIRDEVLSALEYFASRIAPALADLPASVIHNDANDYNVLVQTLGDAGTGPQVTGLFDFGDMCWQPVICDAAIALAYLLMGKEEPVAVCTNFLRGYCSLRRPDPSEISVLLDLIRSRLAVSIAISSHRQRSEPDDPYITISQAPARAALKKLATIDRAVAEELFLATVDAESLPIGQ